MCELFTLIGLSIAGAVGGSSAIAAIPTGVATAIGVATAAAGVATVGAAAVGVVGSVQSARASADMQRKQAEQLKQMQDNSGEPEVARVNNGLQDNSRKARTLSSLRIGLLPQAQTTEEITRNVYGVDTNQVATSTQNMVGLNIAAA